MDEKSKNSIKIEFVDLNGDKHIFYNEEALHGEQVKFVGSSVGKFLRSIGWPNNIIEGAIEEIWN